MITLVLLTTLMLAFAILSESEPVIAGNQLRVSQARALAESGMEHALWALAAGNVLPGEPAPPAGAIRNDDLSSPSAVVPFNGATFTSIGATGGYRVWVTMPDPAEPLRRDIRAIGWTPNPNDPRNAHRQIFASVRALPHLALNAPCALCVRGDLQVQGSALVDSRTDGNCGGAQKYGAYTSGDIDQGGSSEIKGQAGMDPNGNVPDVDYKEGQSTDTFDDFSFNDDHLITLKELAKKNGTYFGPGFSGSTTAAGTAATGTWSGSVSFNSGNKVKNGIVFIDTTTGGNIVSCPTGSPDSCVPTPESEFASATINGNPFVSGNFTGMLVVNGRMSISGNMVINGLVYVMDDLTYNGTGAGEIAGLVISQNVRNSTATAISETDTSSTGNSRIKLNCANARGAGQAPRAFALIPGTYREESD
ncbi:MAG TPA: hypothetical protein VGD07_06840 [Methylomirabilota bacterium]